MHATTIEINTKQFIKNLQIINDFVNQQKSTKICLPVKANAYGHGLVGIAKIAEPYIDYFGAACLNEGQTLRSNGITKPILVFGAFSQEQLVAIIMSNLEVTVSSMLKVQQIAEVCKQFNTTCKVHLKVDVGLNRVGVRINTAWDIIDYIKNNPEIELVGVYSHLSCSDEVASEIVKEQINKFKLFANQVKQLYPNIICHLANSGGICNYPDSYFDMVRPGILGYGYLPSNLKIDSPLQQIKPCFTLKSQVNYFKVVEEDQGISYGHTYITPHRTRVVTIPIGYGDGYRRMLSNQGEVLIRGHKYKISGTICMDMLMVDIGPNGESYVGDEVILIGSQGKDTITLESIAQKCQTITYEILCGFTDRIPRVYI